MDYWRQENLEGLPQLASQADERGYARFAEYCRLREQGVRRDAAAALSEFIVEMRAQPVVKRREFADWVLTYSFHNPRVYNACPTALKQEIIEPAIDEWTRSEPENPKALRWHPDERAMLVAARAVPRDDIAVGRYAMTVLARVDFHTHELPNGYSGETLKGDLADVQTVIDLLHTVADSSFFHPLREEALSLKMLIQKHLV